MYDEIYDGLVKARIISVLDPPIYMDKRGLVVNSPNTTLGQKCDIKKNYPSYILFGDRTGCNTFQKKDGGQKYHVELGLTS